MADSGGAAVARGRCGAWGCGFGGGCASGGRRLGYVSGLRKRHLATLSGQAPIVAPRPFRTSRGLFADGNGSLALRLTPFDRLTALFLCTLRDVLTSLVPRVYAASCYTKYYY